MFTITPVDTFGNRLSISVEGVDFKINPAGVLIDAKNPAKPIDSSGAELENKDIVIALNSIGADVGFVEIESDKGHDSFLLDVPDFLSALKNFLDKSYIES